MGWGPKGRLVGGGSCNTLDRQTPYRQEGSRKDIHKDRLKYDDDQQTSLNAYEEIVVYGVTKTTIAPVDNKLMNW